MKHQMVPTTQGFCFFFFFLFTPGRLPESTQVFFLIELLLFLLSEYIYEAILLFNTYLYKKKISIID